MRLTRYHCMQDGALENVDFVAEWRILDAIFAPSRSSHETFKSHRKPIAVGKILGRHKRPDRQQVTHLLRQLALEVQNESLHLRVLLLPLLEPTRDARWTSFRPNEKQIAERLLIDRATTGERLQWRPTNALSTIRKTFRCWEMSWIR
jgi:hypothetical protein